MKKGFTLAEVLITLAVVGVIAILTIPSIVKNYRYRMYAASIEKTYSQIADAIQAEMQDEHATNFYESTAGVPSDNTNCTKGACYFLNNYFKVARKDCSRTTTKCFMDNYVTPDGTGAGTLPNEYCIQTTNGAAICMVWNAGTTSIFVDTNGPAQPNITGYDVFAMNVNPNGTLRDWDTDSTKCNTKSRSYKHVADYATGCLTKVMKAGWKIED